MSGQPGKEARQFVKFNFFKLDRAFRRLSDDKQRDAKLEFYNAIRQFNRRMLLRPYSLMGTRADAELLLWQIAESPLPFQELAAAIMGTAMGSYLNLAYSYFSQTKRSIYEIRDNPDSAEQSTVQSRCAYRRGLVSLTGLRIPRDSACPERDE